MIKSLKLKLKITKESQILDITTNKNNLKRSSRTLKMHKKNKKNKKDVPNFNVQFKNLKVLTAESTVLITDLKNVIKSDFDEPVTSALLSGKLAQKNSVVITIITMLLKYIDEVIPSLGSKRKSILKDKTGLNSNGELWNDDWLLRITTAIASA